MSTRRKVPIGLLPVLATSGPARWLAWLGLVAASGLIVRGEVARPERPEGVRVVTDLVYREAGGRRARLDVYLPDGPAPAGGWPALLAVHGGGWRGGGKADYGRSLAPLVRSGLAVVAVDYRLARPGSPAWPGNLEDVREAARWVSRHAAEFGINPDRVAAIGASAGGHLALSLALAEPPGGAAPPVRAVIDFYGPTDLRALCASGSPAAGSVAGLLGGPPSMFPDRNAAASPARRVAPGAPPVLILHGDDDALVPLAQSRSLVDALEAAGVPHRLVVLPGARHGFGLRVGRRDLVPDVLAFLDGVWGAGARPAHAGRHTASPAP